MTRLIRFTTTNKIVTATLKLKLLSQSSKCLSRPNTSQMVAAHHLSLHHQVLSGRSGILSFRFFHLTAFNLHLRANPSPSQPEQPLTHDSRNPIGSDSSKLVDSGQSSSGEKFHCSSKETRQCQRLKAEKTGPTAAAAETERMRGTAAAVVRKQDKLFLL